MVRDDILGGVPSADAAASGFDRWGFRNHDVPERSDIVAIGDSHTYGNTATMEDSWPYVLGRLSGRQVSWKTKDWRVRGPSSSWMTPRFVYVDTLPALRRSVEHELYARTAADMHPNRNGYRVIAEDLFEAMKQK